MISKKTIVAILFAALALTALMPRDAHAACASPAGDEGNIMYNDDFNVVQFCDGTNWISMGGGSTDARIGTLTANKWCSVNAGGTAIDCTQNPPAASAGTDTQVIFNDGGTALGGASQMLWDKTNNRLTVGSTTASAIAGVTADVVGKAAANAVIVKPVSGIPAASNGGGGGGGGIQIMTSTARNALSATEGMVIYNSTTKRVEWYNGTHWMAAGNNGIIIDQDGASSATAALSCKNIYDAGQSTGDALYWIDPDGSAVTYSPFQAYCDMTNGGWTLITRMVSGSTGQQAAAAVGTLTGPTQGAVAKLSDATINAIAANTATPVYKINCNTRVNYYKLPSAFSATATTWTGIQVSTTSESSNYFTVNATYSQCSTGPHSCDGSAGSGWGANAGRSPAALYGYGAGFGVSTGCSYTDTASQQAVWSTGSGTAWVK